MTVPNADRATIASEKLTGYLLNVSHKRGGPKARMLLSVEIEGPINTPSGRSVRFRSVWQVDTGTDVPRFITMYPR